jgi:hypothetical protein
VKHRHHNKLGTKDIVPIVAGSSGKRVPPIIIEVEACSDAGRTLVHFDGPLTFTADDLLCGLDNGKEEQCIKEH